MDDLFDVFTEKPEDSVNVTAELSKVPQRKRPTAESGNQDEPKKEQKLDIQEDSSNSEKIKA